MGLKIKDLPPHLADRVRQQLALDAVAAGRRRTDAALAAETVAGELELWVPGEPPKTTHHAKSIGKNWKTGRPTLIDDPALKAARSWYAAQLGHNPDRATLAGPIEAFIQLRWHGQLPAWWQEKPDADNAAKPVIDLLAAGRWLDDDKKVARLIVEKVQVSKDRGDEGPGMYVRLRTLTGLPSLASTARCGTRRIVPR